MFSCEIFKNTFSYLRLPEAASGDVQNFLFPSPPLYIPLSPIAGEVIEVRKFVEGIPSTKIPIAKA